MALAVEEKAYTWRKSYNGQEKEGGRFVFASR